MIAYLDMPSGIWGDMFLGCLVDAGWPLAALRTTIEKMALPPASWSVQAVNVMRGALRARIPWCRVEAEEGDQHRHLSDVRQIIQATDLPETVKARAVAVFTRLAVAEAAVHGTSVEAVHFHEVGALDAIIDIVGVCAGIQALGIERLYASGVPLGEGWTIGPRMAAFLCRPRLHWRCWRAHKRRHAPPGPGELVTPTGAALLAEFATFMQPRMQLQRIGQGTSTKGFCLSRMSPASGWGSQPMADNWCRSRRISTT